MRTLLDIIKQFIRGFFKILFYMSFPLLLIFLLVTTMITIATVAEGMNYFELISYSPPYSYLILIGNIMIILFIIGIIYLEGETEK